MEAPQGIKIDFYPSLDIQKEDLGKVYRIVFTDTTTRLLAVPYELYALSFQIVSHDTGKTFEADLITYLQYNRVDREWFIVTPDMLGYSEGQPIPDGVYTASIVVNNTYTVQHTFLLFNDVETAIEGLLSDAGYVIKVSEIDLRYQNSDKYDFENYSILASLLAAIKENAIDGNIEAAQQALKQAQRVLNII